MKGLHLYAILWIGGALMAASIIALWQKPQLSASPIFSSAYIDLNNAPQEGTIVANLLLSAEELEISGTTFLRRLSAVQPNNKKIPLPSGNKELYRSILEKKINKINSRQEGFDIAPVPGQ